MATESLTRMSDRQLTKLYALTGTIGMTARRKAIRAELEQRGYVYDLGRSDFILCEEWNFDRADDPKDCNERMRSLRKG